MTYRTCLLWAGLCLYPAMSLAESWSGHADLGYSASSGNTDTESLNAKLGLTYVEAPWRHVGRLEVYRATEDGDRDAERYFAGAKTEYSLDEANYLFGTLDYEHDEFGGIRTRNTVAAGYGRVLLDSDRHRLSVEAGPGFRRLRRQDGTRESGAIARAALDYLWQISETSELGQNLLLETGSDNTYTESVSALKVSIVGNLAAKLSYTVKRNSKVPAGLEKTDTYTLVSLSYEFGEKPDS